MRKAFGFIAALLFLAQQTANAQVQVPAQEQEEPRPRLTYYFDPLCGWCYGFSSVMKAFEEKYGAECDIEIVPGGMLAGERAVPMKELSDFLTQAYPSVEQLAGVKFGKPFTEGTLKDSTVLFTSDPASLAIAAFTDFVPGARLQYASLIHKAIYERGVHPTDTGAFASLVEIFAVDSAVFRAKMREPHVKERMQLAYRNALNAGLNGFPTVVLEHKGRRQFIAEGYTPFSTLEQRYRILLAGHVQID
jgi:putative protein-disulfide isomerase